MANPPKIKLRVLYRDVDYLNKLSEEEKQWLFQAELCMKYGFGSFATKEDEKMANAANYRYRNDWLNNSPNKILQHMSDKNNRRKKIKDDTRAIENSEDIEETDSEFEQNIE